MTAAASMPTSSLLSRPIPSTAPAATHSRSSSVRSNRTSSQQTTLLKAKSRVSVVRKWLVASTTSATAQQLAAIACARRPPPASRAISPAPTIDATPASAAGIRSAISERGANAFIVHATTGVSSGWSG